MSFHPHIICNLVLTTTYLVPSLRCDVAEPALEEDGLRPLEGHILVRRQIIHHVVEDL